jgi:hypothetical protein
VVGRKRVLVLLLLFFFFLFSFRRRTIACDNLDPWVVGRARGLTIIGHGLARLVFGWRWLFAIIPFLYSVI